MDIKQLIKELTLDEKAELVSGKDFWFTAGVERLNLNRMMMTDGPSGLRKQADSSDALGLNKSVTAVCFPASSLTSNSFDRERLNELGEHLGEAAKAEQVGVLLGPGINIKRSPLAGRNFEYFSEDPYLTGELATAYVKGVQSKGVGVSVKHFAANNRENQRFTMSSNIDERTLHEIYLAPFEKVVKQAKPATIMCSYNAINGTLNSQNQLLLTKILRQDWGFDGLVMSDWGAVADHVAALKAGLDLEMPGKGDASVTEIKSAVERGDLSETTLDQAVLRVLSMVATWRSESDAQPYDLEEQHQFARKLAAESMVLLKNKDQVLPLKPDDSVAVIGQLAVDARYQGGGSSHVNAYRVSQPLAVIQSEHEKVAFAPGYELTEGETHADLLQSAVATAKAADKVIIFAGFPAQMESEGFDKTTLDLPDNQNQLINAVSEVNPNTVVVLQNGSAVQMPWLDKVAGVLETYLAGEAVGEATWDVLSGKVNPSGKLAETFPIRLSDTPSYLGFNADPENENYREGLFVGYRYYDKKQIPVLFPFGFGLSYTTFTYQNLDLKILSDRVVGTVVVTNTGQRAGTEKVQIYLGNMTSQIEKPIKILADFQKVTLESGESKAVKFEINKRAFSWYNPSEQDWVVDNGLYRVGVGSSSADLHLSQDIEIESGRTPQLTVTMNAYIGDLLEEPALQSAFSKSGLAKVFQPLVENESTDSQMLQNMPLRAAVMLGATTDQIEQFLSIANQV